MKKVSINDARKFSLERVQVTPLMEQDHLATELLCFEAGQSLEPRTYDKAVNYQVLEGEALVGAGESRERLGKGRLLNVSGGTAHTIENAGGGLLVVLATRAV